MDLSQTAKLLYSLLLDRSELSQKNGWQDSEGRTYIVYPVSEIAEMLDKGSTAIKSRTERAGRCRASGEGTRGFSAPNRLYVKVPQMPVVQFSDHMTAIQSENRPSDSRKSDPHKDGKPTFALDGKPTPNQLTINKLKENQLKGASEKPPAPLADIKIFLSESEYAELKEEYPDRLERLIEEMSEFIAATGNDMCAMPPHCALVKPEKKENPKKGNPRLFLQRGREPLTA